MRKTFVSLLLMLVASTASAFNTKELLSTIAMPLAVAAVSNVTGVNQDQLATLVTTLNTANVPPTQFVEVVRYTPVALVDQNGQPFIAYVQQQASQGVTGDALVNAIVQQLQSRYNVTPQLNLTVPATTLVVQNDYVPQMVLTQVGAPVIVTSDPLAFIALPLAVAAVADLAGVPQDQLANFVATLNNANVPPVQMIEVVRYVPVALIDQGQPFVQFVQDQANQGVTGPALVPVIVQRLQPLFPSSTQINVSAPATQPRRVVAERQEFEPPPVVLSRVEEVRQHPHGGPPGQLKKELGLQTGAEVVHGEKRGRQFPPQPGIVQTAPAARRVEGERKGEGEHGDHGKGRREEGAQPMISSSPAPVPAPQAAPRGEGHGKGNGPDKGGPPGQQKEHENGKGKGKD